MVEVLIMGFMEVLIIIGFAIILFLILGILSVYNKLVFYKKKIEDKYDTIDEEIDNISNITKDIVTIVSSKYGEDKVNDVKIVNRNLEGEMDSNIRMYKVLGLIKFLNFVKEKINDGEELEKYKNDVDDCLNRINYAKEFYNNCVLDFDNYRQGFIAKIVFKLFKFKEYNKFEI